MDDQKLASWGNIAKIVAAIVALAALLLGGGFVWNELWHIPDLRYTVLPTYEVGGQHFSGLILENRGRAAASRVLIRIPEVGTPIEASEIQSDERYSVEGGEGNSGVEVWLDRLTAQASVTVYLLTSEDVEIEKSLTIMADRGPAKPATDPDKNLVVVVLLGLAEASLIAVAILVFGLFKDRLSN